MYKHKSRYFSLQILAGIFVGLFLVVLGSLYSFSVSSQTKVENSPPEDNLLLGRLAYTSRNYGPTTPDGRIRIANPDGSGETIASISTALDPDRPAWSPDGTKIAWAGRQNPNDIFVTNENGSGLLNLTNTDSPVIETHPSWSLTGKIAYERRPQSTGAPQIWVMNTDGTGQVQFSGITQASPTDPSWSPDGTILAYTSGNAIWVIDANGTNERRVTSNASTDFDPSWSPDGSKIVFSRGAGISVINLDGTNETPLTSVSGDREPSWSPDGTKIAYRRAAADRGVYTMDPNGANQVRIKADNINFPLCCDVAFENPTWQPLAQTPNTFNINGRIANENFAVPGAIVNLSGTINATAITDAVGNYQFSDLPPGGNYKVSPSLPRYNFAPANRTLNNLTSNQTADFSVAGVCFGSRCIKNGKIAFTRSNEIFTINPDGTNSTNITNNPAVDDAPNYSPDGSNIIFSTDRDGNYEIYRMNADGSNPVRLTNNAAAERTPHYSPDGASIVFVSDRDGNSEVYKMNADGSNQVNLSLNPGIDDWPALTPDGLKIIFARHPFPDPGLRKIFTMNADGSNQQELPGPTGISPGFERISYSPDGSKIMFNHSPDASTQIRVTWTMNANGTNPLKFPADGSYGTYSPDGSRAVFTCCVFNFTNRLRTSDALGSASSANLLTPSNTGNSLPDWQPIVTRRAPFDYDGDGRSDVSVYRPTEGNWYLLRSTEGFTGKKWGIATDVLAPADYDGDLKTDLAIWRPSEGNFYIFNSFDNTIRIENFGLQGDIPTGGDWDGDGKADLAVYRDGAQGVFYYRASMGNPNGGINFVPWGISGDKPVVGDFDGDAKTDAAIYRDGVWYVLKSSDGQLLAAQFGLPNDNVIPADYDADGKTDMAVFRDGVWYLLRSSKGFAAFRFGITNDIPAPADYDGDGSADAAIYRDGIWWILNSQSSTTAVYSFGLGGDKPIPSAYVR